MTTSELASARSYITRAMAESVGRQFPGVRVSFPISESDIRRWAVAVYYPAVPPREFWNASLVAGAKAGSLVAPAEFNPFAWMMEEPGVGDAATVDDGGLTDPDMLFEGRLGIPGPGLRHVLNGGTEVEYSGVPMKPGDVITAVSFHGGYAEKAGRLGLMLFAVTENRLTNQRGELVKVERKTLIRY